MTIINQKKLKDIKNIHEIQGMNGNWDQSEYMRGLFNGLEMAVSIIESREPIFKDPKIIKKSLREKLKKLLW